jgi:hypothetical protein
MIVGKLTINVEDHPGLGEIFVLCANNNTGWVFETSGNQLKLRITKETAALLCNYIDEVLEEKLFSEANV